jgi:hypothetical protein
MRYGRTLRVAAARSRRSEMKMIYRPYGKTGKQVSAVGFGGMRFKAIDDVDACVAMMVEAARGGINYFDTAPMYFGVKSETVYGAGFAELRRLGLPYYCATKTFRSTESEIRREIEEQLKRLGVDCIDFYHMWCITSLEDWETRRKAGALETFQRLKEEGLIGHICCSSHLIGDDIRELLRLGIFEGVLFGYSAYNYRARQAAFDAIREKGLGCVVMNPLGGGLIPQHEQMFASLKRKPENSVVEGALHFLFAHEQICAALVGFQTLEHVREALGAAASYEPMDAASLEAMKRGLTGGLEGICTGCQYCLPCPEGVPIPPLMDAYNLKLLGAGDKQLLGRLRAHWHVSPETAGQCIACGQCEAACTQHLNIIERLKSIAALKEAAKE